MTPDDAVKQILPDLPESVRGRLVALIHAAYLRGQAQAKAAVPPEYWQIGGSLLKVFLTTLLGAIVANQGLEGLDIRAALMAGVAAVIHAAYNYLNPNDTRYGVGKSKES